MRKEPHHDAYHQHAIHDDQHESGKDEKEEPAGRIPRPDHLLQPSVQVIRGKERQRNDQQYQQGSQLQDITISLAFSNAAAVGFSPLSILAIAVIRSSWLSSRILV